MSKSAHQEVALISNHGVIKLKSGSLITIKAYRSDVKGMYVLLNNTAKIFNTNEDVSPEVKRLCFIPFQEIEVVMYDVATNDTDLQEDSTNDSNDIPFG